MKLSPWAAALLTALPVLPVHGRSFVRPRQVLGQPIDDTGRGAPLLGGTNAAVDAQNPDNLGEVPSRDGGTVPNLKWSFSDSKTKLFHGGWTREQVIADLPSSTTVAAAQQHLKKGGIREMHWHRVVSLWEAM